MISILRCPVLFPGSPLTSFTLMQYVAIRFHPHAQLNSLGISIQNFHGFLILIISALKLPKALEFFVRLNTIFPGKPLSLFAIPLYCLIFVRYTRMGFLLSESY